MSDTTTTIRPDSNDVSAWASGGGCATLADCLSDDAAGTYVQPYGPANTTNPSSTLVLHMDAFTLDDTDQLKYVQLWVTADMIAPLSGSDSLDLTLALYNPDESKRTPDQVIRITYPGAGLYTLLPFRSWSDGTAITAEEFADGLIVLVRGELVTATTFEGLRIKELGLDIVYNQAPTISIDGANDDANTRGMAYFHQITYSDAEGDTMERYQDRVYELPAGGFPSGATDDDVIDALEALDITPEYTEERATTLTRLNGFIGCPGRTYRRFVRAADERSGQRYGHWDSDTWAVPAFGSSSQYPYPITIAVVSDAANARVRVTFTDVFFGSNINADSYWLERSDDGGRTYEIVVNGQFIDRTGAGTVFYDRFAPRLTESIYRARAYHDEPFGQMTLYSVSPWVSKSVILGNDGNSWLQSPDDTDGELDLAFIHAGTSFERQRGENQSVYYAEGREEPIVFAGTIVLANGQLQLTFTDEEHFEMFEALRELQGKLLLRTLYGEGPLIDMWIKLGSPGIDTLVGGYSMITKGQLHRVSIPYYEVTSPQTREIIGQS